MYSVTIAFRQNEISRLATTPRGYWAFFDLEIGTIWKRIGISETEEEAKELAISKDFELMTFQSTYNFLVFCAKKYRENYKRTLEGFEWGTIIEVFINDLVDEGDEVRVFYSTKTFQDSVTIQKESYQAYVAINGKPSGIRELAWEKTKEQWMIK